MSSSATGALRVDRHSPGLSLRVGRRFGYGVRRPWLWPTPAAAAWRLQRLFRPSIDPSFRRSLRAFVELIRGRGTRVASLADGLRSLEAILAAEDSARRVRSGQSGRRWDGRSLRVLLITDWMSGVGGAERYVVSLRDGLRAAGDEVRLLTSTAGSAGDGTADYRAYGTERVAVQTVLQIANPFAAIAVKSAVRDFRPDVALVNMFEYHLSPAILGQLRDVPSVHSVTDYKCICPWAPSSCQAGACATSVPVWSAGGPGCLNLPHWLRDQPRYALIRAGRRHFNRVLACSRWVQRELALNGVESEHLALPVVKQGPGFRRAPAPEPMFVYCGRLEATKGLELLLHAFVRLLKVAPTATLRIVGRGPQRALLERRIQALGIGPRSPFGAGSLRPRWSTKLPMRGRWLCPRCGRNRSAWWHSRRSSGECRSLRARAAASARW